MNKHFTAKNAKETQEFAAKFAKSLLKKEFRKTAVIGLIGELGAGKTVFTQGFAKGLGIKQIVASPTFVIEKIYKLGNSAQGRSASGGKKHRHLIHIDAYRIEKPKEIADLGFKDLIKDSRNIILIEWADRIKKILPKKTIFIFFKSAGEKKRKITIKNKNGG